MFPLVGLHELVELGTLRRRERASKDGVKIHEHVLVRAKERGSPASEDFRNPVFSSRPVGQLHKNCHVEKAGSRLPLDGDLHCGGGKDHLPVLCRRAFQRVVFSPQVFVERLPDGHRVAVGEIHHLLLEDTGGIVILAASRREYPVPGFFPRGKKFDCLRLAARRQHGCETGTQPAAGWNLQLHDQVACT